MDYKKLTIGLLSPDGARYTREAADAIRYLVDRCASLEEARENANEACACWRNLYTVGRDTPEPIRSGRPCKPSHGAGNGQRTENLLPLGMGSVN